MAADSNMDTTGPRVEVKTLSDRAIAFPLDAALTTVGALRALLAAKEQTAADKIILISEGRVLDDPTPLGSLPSSVQPATQIRTTAVHWLHMEPLALTLDPIEAAKDWDAKNRLRCFVGIHHLSQRSFPRAAALLVECLATFEDVTFLPFKDLVKYTIVAAILVLDRPALSKHILQAPEVLEVIEDLPELKALVDTLYLCQYAAFFQALAVVEALLQRDWLLRPHTAFIVKELRVRAYAQMLQSYRSLSLASMAAHFGVSVAFIDAEVSRFIAAGRLNGVIDKVAGVVITSPPDRRNQEHQAMLKSGDALLAKVHKLARIVSQ